MNLHDLPALYADHPDRFCGLPSAAYIERLGRSPRRTSFRHGA